MLRQLIRVSYKISREIDKIGRLTDQSDIDQIRSYKPQAHEAGYNRRTVVVYSPVHKATCDSLYRLYLPQSTQGRGKD